MITFTPTGDLLTDLNNCINNTTAMHVSYIDKEGISSDRVIAPVEVRGSGVYLFSLEKNGEPDSGLRFFLLASIGTHEVIDQQFDPESFKNQ